MTKKYDEEFSYIIVKVVCPRGKEDKARELMRKLNARMPKKYEIDETYGQATPYTPMGYDPNDDGLGCGY